jgi:hypothetical protein
VGKRKRSMGKISAKKKKEKSKKKYSSSVSNLQKCFEVNPSFSLIICQYSLKSRNSLKMTEYYSEVSS